jgi:hypothetical protein
MIIRSLKLSSVIAAACLGALCGAGQCEELAPYAGRTIVLDEMRGTVYYATNGADFVVVATLDSDGRAVRFVTTLQPGQTTKISTPGAADQPEMAIEFRRDGDRLFIDEHPRRIQTGEISYAHSAREGR